jgi:SAM-dependent methyltransferase
LRGTLRGGWTLVFGGPSRTGRGLVEGIVSMGRFETTVPRYAAYREPYPPAFFSAVAEALALDGRQALIDLGTGPGLLGLGFAPYVRCVVGVDPEPAMVAEARQAAARAKIDFAIIEGRTEDLTVDVGPFDVATIGRALHWMERGGAVAALDRILAPDGRILICGSSSLAGDVNPWRASYDEVLRVWGDDREGRHRRLYQTFFEGSRFAPVQEIEVVYDQTVTPGALVERALTRSTSSPAVLGGRLEPFRAALVEALTPFFPNGTARETLEVKARVFAAR